MEINVKKFIEQSKGTIHNANNQIDLLKQIETNMKVDKKPPSVCEHESCTPQ